jgi:hypothetical protein
VPYRPRPAGYPSSRGSLALALEGRHRRVQEEPGRWLSGHGGLPGDVDRQSDAVVLAGYLDVDAAGLVAPVDATLKTACCRGARATVDDHGAQVSLGRRQARPRRSSKPTPKAEPIPTGEQSIERVDGDTAELSNGPSLEATKTSTSANAAHWAANVFTGRTAVLIVCGLGAVDDGLRDGLSSFGAPLSIRTQVAIYVRNGWSELTANRFSAPGAPGQDNLNEAALEFWRSKPASSIVETEADALAMDGCPSRGGDLCASTGMAHGASAGAVKHRPRS